MPRLGRKQRTPLPFRFPSHLFQCIVLFYHLPSVGSLAAFGYCTRCQKQHGIPTTDEAVHYAKQLRQALENTGRLDLFNDEDSDGDPLLNTTLLHTVRGKMFGVLVCRHSTSNATVVLRAFAGKIRSYGWTLAGYVDPLVVPETIPRFVDLRDQVSELTDQMNFLQMNTTNTSDIDAHQTEWKHLKDQRSARSREALEVFRQELRVTNFRGESALLSDVFLPSPTQTSMPHGGKSKQKRQMPVGVGECCATKLVAAAAQQQLQPISIAEFFVGKSDRRRVENDADVYYDACPDRCQKVLGFMLCGHDDAEGIAPRL